MISPTPVFDSSPSSTTDTTMPIYKGKAAHRSWPQLPEELVRHIATFYLWDLSATSYCPKVWESREHWHNRMVYTALRDANDLERHLMTLCPQWHAALETHLFWQQAIALIDPLDALAQHAFVHPTPPTNVHSSSALRPAYPQPVRLSPWRHFRNISIYSCYVCRINAPATTAGLTTAKRTIHSPYFKSVPICREHDERRNEFCGLCLKDAPPYDNPLASSLAAAIACLENEDEETWPGVEATCRICRGEGLWRSVMDNPRDREAIGGLKLISEDWETRQCVEGFIDLAEGSIGDVITLAQEKWWLRKYTRLGDMMQQALAATRYNNSTRHGAYERSGADFPDIPPEQDEEEEEEEEEEDDIELLQMTEEGGVRDLALGDWARQRVLDGFWISPADIWYKNALPGKPLAVPAAHPCPWTREPSPFLSDEGGSDARAHSAEEDVHPRQATAAAEMPPSFALCEQAYVAHQRQMRLVLLPPMKNIVRKLVIECATPRLNGGRIEDPAIRAARMSAEDVLTVLREDEGVWFDGVDWAERRREEDASAGSGRSGNDDSASSSSSSTGSRSSNGTSPVLSTTTLQTTPSPPPSGHAASVDDAKKEDDARVAHESLVKPVTIAVGPVLDPPRLLRPIPYVPITTTHMPQYSLEAFRAVWREACAPLYHCRCKICERAMAKQNAANGNVEGSEVGQTPQQQQHQQQVVQVQLPVSPTKTAKTTRPIVVPSQQQHAYPPQSKYIVRERRTTSPPVTIRLTEMAQLDGEGEEEVDLDVDVSEGMVDEEEEEEENEDGDEEGDGDGDDDEDLEELIRAAEGPVVVEEEEEEEDVENETPVRRSSSFHANSKSSSGDGHHGVAMTPTRSRKRSCDEIVEGFDDVGGERTKTLASEIDRRTSASPKRQRVGYEDRERKARSPSLGSVSSVSSSSPRSASASRSAELLPSPVTTTSTSAIGVGGRSRKRSSEELLDEEVEGEGRTEESGQGNKLRLRVKTRRKEEVGTLIDEDLPRGAVNESRMENATKKIRVSPPSDGDDDEYEGGDMEGRKTGHRRSRSMQRLQQHQGQNHQHRYPLKRRYSRERSSPHRLDPSQVRRARTASSDSAESGVGAGSSGTGSGADNSSATASPPPSTSDSSLVDGLLGAEEELGVGTG